MRNGSRRPRRQRLGFVVRWEMLLCVSLGCTIAFGASVSPEFLPQANSSTSASFGEVAIMALPLTLIIVTGKIHLSVASMLGLSGVLHGLPLRARVADLAGHARGHRLGHALGAFNGFLVTRAGLPSLAVTIGTLTLYRGFAQVILPTARSAVPRPATRASASTRSPAPTSRTRSRSSVCSRRLRGRAPPDAVRPGDLRDRLGRGSGAVRGHPRQADQVWLYVLSGMLRGFAGVLWTLRFASARYDSGIGLELYVVTIVLLGGVSIFGGRGTIAGSCSPSPSSAGSRRR